MPNINRHVATRQPLWRGPGEDGITFSLLSKFLVCRERFRLLVCEGIGPPDEFNHRLEYGSMWHVCEEFHAQGQAWEGPLADYCRDLCLRYPTQQEEVARWYQVCKVQFPVYVKYWQAHPDVMNRTPLLQEEKFCVRYMLPSKRSVLLRGKWDSVDVIGHSEHAAVYLQENKTKGDVRIGQIQSQLSFDLQTMLYLIALHKSDETWDKIANSSRLPNSIMDNPYPCGVRYNVVRRPLSWGKGSIIRHKATKGSKCPKCKGSGAVCLKCGGLGRIGAKPEETQEHFYGRLRAIIEESPQDFFYRWKVDIRDSDIKRFKDECLDPILEQLCDWWEHIENCMHAEVSPFHQSSSEVDPKGIHWRRPYGVYNVLDEGGTTPYDDYMRTGSELGLSRVTNLFPELT